MGNCQKSRNVPLVLITRSNLPEIVQRCPQLSGTLKELPGGLPGDAKRDLILPKQVLCPFGFCVPLPTIFLGEGDADRNHGDA